MRKKGSVCVVNYVVHSADDAGDEIWRICERPPSTAHEVDRRTGLKFSFGIGDIDPGLEDLIPQSGSVCVQKGNRNFAIEVVQGPIEMSTDEVFCELVKLKSLGNGALKKGELAEALAYYNEGISLMTSPEFNRRTPKDISDVIVPMYLNKSLCCLKLEQWRDAIDSCSQVLEVDSNNAKAFYRRGVARFENQEIGPGKRDLLSAQFLEPADPDIKQKLDEISRAENSCMRINSDYKKNSQNKRTVIGIHLSFPGPTPSSEIIKIQLFDDLVPRTVENFKRLIPNYIGCRIFKIIKSQICQMGDFEYNDGSGGNCAVEPDTVVRDRKFFNDERLDGFHDRKGLVGMANYGPNTNASQFYITLDSCPHLDGKHVVFGEVVENIACIEKINQYANETVFDTNPTQVVTITDINLVEK